MEPEYIELKNLFEKLNLKLNFDLTQEEKDTINRNYSEDKREEEIYKLKRDIYKQRVDRAEILLSFLTLKYNFNYSLLTSFMKIYHQILEIDYMEERIKSFDLKKLIGEQPFELEDFYYHYIYHYYKIVLEKIEDTKKINVILKRIKQLKDLVYDGFSIMDNLDLVFNYKFINRDEYNKELLERYEKKLNEHFFLDKTKLTDRLTKVKISLPDLNIFRNKRVFNGLAQGNYAFIPLTGYRIEKEVNIGDIYQFKGQNIVSTKKRKIFPIKRLSKFTTIPREVLMSYNYEILGKRMERVNIIKRLEEINNSHEFMRKLIFTIFIDYILLFISDLTNILKDKNLGLLMSGGFAYRYYNKSYITEDLDLIIGNLVENKISIKPIEKYSETFRIIMDYFNNIKQEDFTRDIILNIIKKFFKDIKRLGINLNNFENIKQFYKQVEDDNIELEFNLSTPPHNNKILKLTATLNNINRFAFVDININDKLKAINTFSIINKINPIEIEENYLRNEFNVDQLYLFYQKQIENTFYPNITSINPIYDTASILNIINLDYILYEKTYLINKLNYDLFFGIIPDDYLIERIMSEKSRLLEKFNKLLKTQNEYNRFYNFNPLPEQIQLFNTFIG